MATTESGGGTVDRAAAGWSRAALTGANAVTAYALVLGWTGEGATAGIAAIAALHLAWFTEMATEALHRRRLVSGWWYAPVVLTLAGSGIRLLTMMPG
ncbi:hypothetical protein ABT354_34845 [Streptomyces sp. NPDC000594]|uniref:hypothetical protein n=1 Tax=Streptomyces sp. NPDC000594 TaxID=3154261 RepID=UPI003316F485